MQTNQPTGVEGGIVSNIGIQTLYDTRDNIFTTTKGEFVKFDLLGSSSLLGSQFSYLKMSLDARYFIPTSTTTSLGLHFRTGAIIGKPPFFDLNYFGTPSIGRGVTDRRYMDNNIYSMQAEFRYPIYKRLTGVAFSTINAVSSKYLVFDQSKFIPTIGAGIRITVNKREKNQIRIDGAYSEEGLNFYLTASNAF